MKYKIVNLSKFVVNLLNEDGSLNESIEPSGSKLRVQETLRQTGEINGSPVIKFDGVDDKMVGVDDGLDVSTGDFTICGVIRRNANPAKEVIFSKQTGSYDGVFTNINAIAVKSSGGGQ